ncbi:NAD-dependent protein deacetylase of SIR2 family [Salmonella enterica subsp. enterica serovar Havana]|nr:NAD-dependent protein deacetylase of SIR2 family [Salmonella enterica subsp. enterica serovar Havana]
MQSRRFHRLSRFRKNKRLLRERLRQRIFFRDRVVPEMMEKPKSISPYRCRNFCRVWYSYVSRGGWPLGRASG